MLKNNQPLKEYCDGLILFTSESCNLQCSYCDMATHINKEKHASEARKVKESLINGQYLNTIQKAFERLEINPNQIKNLELTVSLVSQSERVSPMKASEIICKYVIHSPPYLLV